MHCRRFADGGYKRRRVRVVPHRLEDVRLEQADAAVRRTAIAAPAVLCEHCVVDEKFAYLRESFQVFPKFSDVIFDARDEVRLYGVPVLAEPVHRTIFGNLAAFSCFHADIIANNCIKIKRKCRIIAIIRPKMSKAPLRKDCQNGTIPMLDFSVANVSQLVSAS